MTMAALRTRYLLGRSHLVVVVCQPDQHDGLEYLGPCIIKGPEGEPPPREFLHWVPVGPLDAGV